MKQKINLRLALVALVALVLTTLGVTRVYYDLFQQQVRRDLRITAQMLSASGDFEDPGHLPSLPAGDLRVTWVDGSGTVLYDNETDAGSLPNHGNRPEVRMALETGTGETVRRSDTLNLNTFYYATRLPGGTVLRLAAEARSMTSVFLAAAPVLVGIILLIFLGCILLSHLLTAQLIKPIEEMAAHLDEPGRPVAYRELEPFAREIRAQHEKILSAAKSRQEFTANVSHELKTPLTAISGYAELVENGMADGAQTVRFAGEIRKNAARLLSLINDILRLSELDDGSPCGEFQRVELLALTREVCGSLRLHAEEKSIRLQSFGRETEILGDRELLKEMLENLVQNAIRYNREGGFVQVTVKGSPHPAITVEDNGIGIPVDAQERVFERFYRVDKSRSRSRGGTGLGLAIVKHIVLLHGGSIRLESRLGEGTKITVTF